MPAGIKGQGHQSHAKACKIGLALATDIEQAAVKGHRHCQPGQDKAGGVKQGETNALAKPKRPLEHQLHRLPGTFAN